MPKHVRTGIRELAVIGDRRTVAVVAADGSIPWYCPGRFDRPSLFAALLDDEKGGAWAFEVPSARPAGRAYIEDSAVLETRLELATGHFSVTDWMPMGPDCPRSICRLFSAPPEAVGVVVRPAPNYARDAADLRTDQGGVCINGNWWLYSSEDLEIDDGAIHFELPPGKETWAVLADAPIAPPSRADVQRWLDGTLAEWRGIASRITYHGPFERQVAQSLRALRLLTYGESGGIVAAATTSLPEVPGGSRNYDYRYVWMRDAGMIASALVRAGSTGPDERLFLDFICGSKQEVDDKPLLPPFLSLDSEPAPDESRIELSGFADSRPVRIGNGANDQLQLDGFANVLLAAKLIYGRHDTREHWETVRQIADFLVDNWHQPDYGIWEEHESRQYTASKVIVSCGLRYLADFAEERQQADRWLGAVQKIDQYVAEHCLTADGAYAVFAGSDAVDVSAALFPTWGYCEAEAPEMLATIDALERDYCRGHLYWRHLEELERFGEGAFLAGTIWVAQYWIIRNDLDRTRQILEAALEYSNDLGFFAEEADPDSGTMLGNFPQTFVHASFIGAVIDYRTAMQGRPGEPT
ncbi:glycoside hydrolase family 15 protein [Lysobacter sp. D1-1-M9]|uniref:glycoside hydrolase family 15 protein n=1 Tax=Novilysobacter longmucuonensis TaxID=3098603 RepID=UPI002FCAEA93